MRLRALCASLVAGSAAWAGVSLSAAPPGPGGAATGPPAAGTAGVAEASPAAGTAGVAEAAGAAGLAEEVEAPFQAADAPYDGLYHFVRIRYGDSRGGSGFRRRGGGAMWAHDYPRAERNFLRIIDETTFVGSQTEASNVVTLDDPELFKHPIAYIVEVGSWNPTDEEVERLGEYLLKGGFLIVDDFRDERGCCRNLDNLAFHLERALPGLSMIRLEDTHEIFDSFFRIVPQDVIPPYGPRNPVWFGVFEDNDPARRLLAVINYNNDIAEYWEFSDRGYYPIDLANEAYKLGVNYVVYGLTH